MRTLPGLAVLIVLALGGCAGRTPPVPACAGPVFALNPGAWTPDAETVR